MKNITVSVDEETHRMARIRAAQLDTSVSALVRDYLRALGEDDSPRDETAADDGKPGDAASDDAVRRHVERLYTEARARAEALTGRPVRNNQELLEVRRRLIAEVAADFKARGIGIKMPGIVNREEMYDRSRARLEASLAAAEERGDVLESELAALKASIEDDGLPGIAFDQTSQPQQRA